MTRSKDKSEKTATHPTKVLNVEIPEPVYWHIRSCATESRMSVKAFMTEFCKTATSLPVSVDSSHSNTDSENVRARTQSNDHHGSQAIVA